MKRGVAGIKCIVKPENSKANFDVTLHSCRNIYQVLDTIWTRYYRTYDTIYVLSISDGKKQRNILPEPICISNNQYTYNDPNGAPVVFGRKGGISLEGGEFTPNKKNVINQQATKAVTKATAHPALPAPAKGINKKMPEKAGLIGGKVIRKTPLYEVKEL